MCTAKIWRRRLFRSPWNFSVLKFKLFLRWTIYTPNTRLKGAWAYIGYQRTNPRIGQIIKVMILDNICSTHSKCIYKFSAIRIESFIANFNLDLSNSIYAHVLLISGVLGTRYLFYYLLSFSFHRFIHFAVTVLILISCPLRIFYFYLPRYFICH